MSTPLSALTLALRDFYRNSWRLVPVNAALGAVLVAVGVAAFAVHAALLLVVLAGPVAAALMHATVTLVRTENVAVADAWQGLRLHWRRGLELGSGGAALLGLGALALRFYGRVSYGWPLVFLTLYLLLLLGVYQLLVWTLAIAEPGRPLRVACRDAAVLAARRPAATLLLGLALLLVNVAGIAAGVMPFLTLTVAYSFLAVARFALPRPAVEQV